MINQLFCNKDDTYDEDMMTFEHKKWKQTMNEVFARTLANMTIKNANILYLDGFEMHTTQTLRSQFGKDITLFVANDCEKTCEKLRESNDIDYVVYDNLSNVVNNKWRHVDFHGAYLDLCGGSSQGIVDLLKIIMDNGRKRTLSVLGITITPRDPNGQNMTQRIDAIEMEIKKRCKITRMQDVYSDINQWTHSGVVTRFYTLF